LVHVAFQRGTPTAAVALEREQFKVGLALVYRLESPFKADVGGKHVFIPVEQEVHLRGV